MTTRTGSALTSAVMAIAGAGLLGFAGYTASTGNSIFGACGAGTCSHAHHTIADASTDASYTKDSCCPLGATAMSVAAAPTAAASDASKYASKDGVCPMYAASTMASAAEAMTVIAAAMPVVMPAAFFDASGTTVNYSEPTACGSGSCGHAHHEAKSCDSCTSACSEKKDGPCTKPTEETSEGKRVAQAL